jgi:hypothetical protein
MKIRFSVLMWMIMMFSTCYAFDWTSKEFSQENMFAGYNVKSDIINFDYSKLAYPVTESVIGIKDSTVTVKTPVKRAKPRPLTEEEKAELLKIKVENGFLMVFSFIMVFCGCICWIVYIPRILIWSFLWVRRKVIEFNKEYKEFEKNMENKKI